MTGSGGSATGRPAPWPRAAASAVGAATRSAATAVAAALVSALVAVLRGYQRFLSPLFPPSCRFHPTCSSYAVEALRTHGLLRGAALTLVRLAKCAPWHPGGLDPVPPRGHRRAGPASSGGTITEERATS